MFIVFHVLPAPWLVLRCAGQGSYSQSMSRRNPLLLAALGVTLATSIAWARTHTVTFGDTMTVRLFVAAGNDSKVEIQVRPLMVGSRIKDFTTGEAHDINDHQFVIRQAYRVNDQLPEDGKTQPQWRWQRGGWLLVDKDNGHVDEIALPEFDTYYSAASWYRDYAAYCGVSSSGDRLYAVVAQIGQKKPIVIRELGAPHVKDQPESECAAPEWQTKSMQVTFKPAGGQAVTLPVAEDVKQQPVASTR